MAGDARFGRKGVRRAEPASPIVVAIDTGVERDGRFVRCAGGENRDHQQHEARANDHALLSSAEFGKELALMGGVDTQGILPNGTADQVRKATAELLEGMTTLGGGYIFAASHTIPPETPDDNIFAMYDEAGISREEIFDRAAHIRNSSPLFEHG